MMNSRFIRTTGKAFLGIAFTTAAIFSQTVVCTLDSAHYQTVKGWGCFPSWQRSTTWGQGAGIVNRTGVQTALYRDLGITLIRMNILYEFFDPTQQDSLNRTHLDNQVAEIRAAKSINNSISFIASIWTPPAAFKTPRNTAGKVDGQPTHLTGFGTGDKNSPPTDAERRFCGFVARVLLYFRDAGIGLPVALSIQNEPDMAVDYDGCVYDTSQYIRVVKEMRRTLDARGCESVVIHGPEGCCFNANPNMVGSRWEQLVDPTASAAVGALVTHSYDWAGGWPGYFHTEFSNFKAAVDRFPNKDLWMTEWYCDTSDPLEAALGTLRHVCRDMVGFRFNYWVYWVAWSYNNTHSGLMYGEVPANSSQAPLWSKTGRALGRLWNLAKPPCRVMHLTSSDTAMRDSPFYGPSAAGECDMAAFDGNQGMTVLVVNKNAPAREVRLRGLQPGGKATLYELSASRDMDSTGTMGVSTTGELQMNVPAKAAIALYLPHGAVGTENARPRSSAHRIGSLKLSRKTMCNGLEISQGDVRYNLQGRPIGTRNDRLALRKASR